MVSHAPVIYVWRIAVRVLCRVFDQHSLTKEEWQEKIVNWHMEHKGLMRLVMALLLNIFKPPDIFLLLFYSV